MLHILTWHKNINSEYGAHQGFLYPTVLYEQYERKESSRMAVGFLRAASYLAGCQGCIDVPEGKMSLSVSLQISQVSNENFW